MPDELKDKGVEEVGICQIREFNAVFLFIRHVATKAYEQKKNKV